MPILERTIVEEGMAGKMCSPLSLTRGIVNVMSDNTVPEEKLEI